MLNCLFQHGGKKRELVETTDEASASTSRKRLKVEMN